MQAIKSSSCSYQTSKIGIAKKALHIYQILKVQIMAYAEVKNLMCLSVTGEQRDVIIQLFHHYGWEFEEVIVPDTLTQINSESPSNGGDTHGHESSDVTTATQAMEDSESDETMNQAQIEQPFIIEQTEGADKCEHCLCSPCITDEGNRQMWWGTQPVAPHRLNTSARKYAYRRFWTMLYHRQIWLDPEYMARKVTALGQDARRVNFVYHRRDIMPDCVIRQVRRWYPNPRGVAYMGHMWE